MALTSWLATYDVASDRRRSQVASVFEPYGYRVLYSTFEVQLEPRAAAGVYARAARLLAPGDRLLMVRHCARCQVAAWGSPIELGPVTVVVG